MTAAVRTGRSGPFIPFGFTDQCVDFASIGVDDLLDRMLPVG